MLRRSERHSIGLIALAILMSALMLLTCLASVASAVVPPEAIYGYVKDANGNPISGATVRDLSGSGIATSASNGYYVFGVTTGGTHSVKASKSGFVDQIKSVVVSTRTGFGVGNFNLGPIPSSVAEFSKNSFPDDKALHINFVNGYTLSIYLYKPDGSLAQSYVNLPVGPGYITYSAVNKPAGIWKFVAVSATGSWERTAWLGYRTIDYTSDYPTNNFSGLTIGMCSKTSLGSDTAGITTSVGVNMVSYVNEGGINGAFEHSVNIQVATKYMDNNVQSGDTINLSILVIEKVIWDPDKVGSGQSAYGSSSSVSNSAIRIMDGMAGDSASNEMKPSSGGSYVGLIGDVAVSSVTAAIVGGPWGYAIDMGYIALMAAFNSNSANSHLADFGGGTMASSTWDRQDIFVAETEATTYNTVKLYLGAQDTSYAYKIYAVFGGISGGITYEIVSNPVYICVT